MSTPYNITEGHHVFTLGQVQGNTIHYNFDQVWIYLQHKGQLLFGKRFKLHETDREIILKLCCYYIQDQEFCHAHNIDLKKGILLSGPEGCGKASLMKLLRHVILKPKLYKVVHSRNIVFQFNQTGTKAIEAYGNRYAYCFLGLGLEPQGKFYSNNCNVMREIIYSRHDLFLKTGIKTYGTTQLNALEIESNYGTRVRSMMRQLFNLMTFSTHSKNKYT
ncbi:ATPase [Formosa sp. A9]|uniref:ATPase n=1 Tax=Formosa sp. A9 TaxID=3442641 RepID=UPI003EB9EAFB